MFLLEFSLRAVVAALAIMFPSHPATRTSPLYLSNTTYSSRIRLSSYGSQTDSPSSHRWGKEYTGEAFDVSRGATSYGGLGGSVESAGSSGSVGGYAASGSGWVPLMVSTPLIGSDTESDSNISTHSRRHPLSYEE